MAFKLDDINFQTVYDPKGFVESCDAAYRAKVSRAADMIIDNKARSRIVLLSGPSGSGKTTTAKKIAEELNSRGIGTHYISMDDYYMTVDPETSPRTPEGDYDFESPYCLDLALLDRHFTQLDNGEAIEVPSYDFATASRLPEPLKTVRLGSDEVVVVEGIHALNSMLTDAHPEAFKLYISAQSDVIFNGIVVFKRTWFRLVRRMVRDNNFRGASADTTMGMWANVRRGEKAFISPFKNRANYQFDSGHAYELPLMRRTATELFRTVPEGIERYDELRAVLPALQLVGDIDETLVPVNSLIREFIGGGIY